MRAWGALLALWVALSGCAAPHALREADRLYLVRPFGTVQPLDMHRGVWSDVRVCLGDKVRAPFVGPDEVRWVVAEDIIEVVEGVYLYGATIENGGEWIIVIEREQWMRAHTPSHEAIHVLSRARGHPTELFICEFPSATFLPLRVVEPVLLDHLRERYAQGDTL